MKLNTSFSLRIFAFFLFLISSIYITYPLIFHLGNFTTGFGDEMLLAWIHKWVIHELFTNPLNLFNATIFYPFTNSLAYSDIFLTGSLLTALPVFFVGQPIAANNITIISSLTLLGFSIYLLSYYLTKDFLASLLAGVILIFCPAILNFTVHIQLLEIYWVPLAILSFLHFLETNKKKYLLLTLLFFLLQTYNSFLPGYFILFSLSIILLVKWIENKKIIKQILIPQNLFLLFGTLLLLLPIMIPYFQVSHEFHYVRDIRDTIHFALQPEDLLYPSSATRLQQILRELPFNQHSQNDEYTAGYVGFIFSILIITSFAFVIKNWKKNTYAIKSFFIIAITAIILSLGPLLHLGRHTIHSPFPVPLPYLAFYYLFPGFKGFRDSGRWEILFILTMAIVSAIVLQKLLTRVSCQKKILIYALLLISILAEYNFPMHFKQMPQTQSFPKVYTWLSTTPMNTRIVEMPIYNWNMFPYASQEQIRDYYNTVYFRKTMNGASGFSPPPWQITVTGLLKTFPDKKSINSLKRIGINYIVVHKKEYDKLNADHYKVDSVRIKSGNQVVNLLKQDKSVSLTKQFDNDYVFRIK